MSSLKLLVIEDNAADYYLLENMINRLTGISIILNWKKKLSDGIKAIQSEEEFDTILLDLGLPDSYGLETVSKLNQQTKTKLPIIVLTGADENSLGIKTLKAGAQDFLIKGQYGSNLLLRTIMYAIERNQLKYEVLENEEKFRSIVETTSDWIWEVNEKGTFTYSNPKITDLLGYSVEEIIGQPTHKFRSFKEQEKMMPVFMQYITTMQPFAQIENIYIHKNGQERIMESSGIPIFDASGEFCGYRCIDRDITEKKKIEEDLKKSEETYRSLVETTTDWIWEVDNDSNYTYSNPKVKDILGYEPDEIIGRQTSDFFPPDVLEKYSIYSREIKNKKEPFSNVEYVSIHKNGQRKILESSGVPILDENGELLGYRGIDRDITERKKARIALKESEEKYRTLIESMNEGLATIDSNCIITFANSRLLEMLGYTEEEFLGKKTDELFAKEGNKAFREQCKLRRKGHSTPYENSLVRKDGTSIDLLVSPKPVFDDNGKFVSVSAIITDITEMKKAQKALEESEEQYRTLVETMNEGLIIINNKNIITFINQRIMEMVGYSEEELKGKSHFDFLTEESKKMFRKQMKERRKGKAEPYEMSFSGKDGSIIEVILSPKPLFNDSGKHIGSFAVITDITEMKKAQKALEESEKRFRDIVETSTEWIWEMNLDGVFTYCNPKSYDLIGFKPEELVGKRFDFKLNPEESKEALENWAKFIEKKLPFYSREQTSIHKNGQEIVMISTGVAIYSEQGERIGYRGSNRDITELRKSEDIRRLAYEQIVNNIQEFANLIDGIRNPLSVILAAIDLDIENWKDLISTQTKMIEAIAEQIDLRWAESEDFRNILIEKLK